ncbi:MAG: C25 family cysteine peptidase [Bacteroidales bacterium]|nr:C25 family cysteine peptidase [Bacteroidales bacterium]
MKKILLFILLIIWGMSYASGHEWVGIVSSQPGPATSQLIGSTLDKSIIHFRLNGFFLEEVATPKGTAFRISLDEATPLLQAGSPDLPKLTASVIIPDLARMAVKVTHAEYTDYPDLFLAPSKGNLTRDIDPSSVPYVFGKAYNRDEYFPGKLAQLQTPYILRDYRGQTVAVYPFQYNPVTHTLRVYHSMTVEIKSVDDAGINPFYRTKENDRVDAEFNRIYQRHFMNLRQVRYTPLEEQGNMLVICYGDFMDEMEPFIEWKRMTGIPIEMVDVATIGNSSQIKTYVDNYYTTYGLTFLLLVGDAEQVPTRAYGGVSASDNSYGFITGDDSYAEVFVGRFSAETPEQVTTQVERVIQYEKNPLTSTDWFTHQVGIASSQGPGDDNELDYEHMRNIQSDVLNYTYTYVAELFDGSQGNLDSPGNPTPAMVAAEINLGTSMIAYTGHGSSSSWSTSGFSSSHVNQLTNTEMLPFIWSVACSNGTFTGSTCFAEAWLRATDTDGNPTGAIATLMSTVSQSWDPPMDGQDEMVDILVESYTDNIKRTYGGISVNGCMKMNDTYGDDGSYETNAWMCFGDPSLVVRTAFPQTMTVAHNPTIFIGAAQFTVTCDVEGAQVGLTIGDQLLGSATIQGGYATIEFEPLLAPDTMTVVTSAYNHIPVIGEVQIIPAEGPYVIYHAFEVNDSESNGNGRLDYGEEAWLNVELLNVGSEEANNLTASLTSADTYVTITDGSETYGVIPPGETKMVNNAFRVKVGNDVPDGHIILYSLQVTGNERESWNSNFAVLAHAPVLSMNTWTISDPEGNENGKLDPGETVQITIQINNTGTADAYNAEGSLTSGDPYISISQSQAEIGDIMAGETGEATFSVNVSEDTPAGHLAAFSLDITADMEVTSNGNFTAIVGQIPVLVLDLDPNQSSGLVMKQTLDDLGINSEYFSSFPQDLNLNLYASVFVCLGVYWDNHVLSQDEGTRLASYLNLGGKLYMEGGDTWAYNENTPVHGMFSIYGSADGTSDLGILYGQTGTPVDEMVFAYTGENKYIDHLEALPPAQLLFLNENPSYGCAVANEAGNYKTIGASFEFGGLADSDAPSTKADLMTGYLTFFGIQQAPLGSASGTVTQEGTGNPIIGAQVSVGTHMTYTDENGMFTGNFPVGTWPICAVATGYEMICESVTIYVDSTVVHDFILSYLPPPTNLQAELNENMVSLSWELATDRTLNHFIVYRSKDEGEYSKIATPVDPFYTDILTISGLYTYFVTALYDEASESDATNTATVEFTATGIINPSLIPQQTRLGSNYPNPFTETTTLRYDLSKDGDVFIKIFNTSGENVRLLLHENAQAGHYELVWDGKDNFGRPVPSGVYVFQLKSGNYLHSRKMILMR